VEYTASNGLDSETYGSIFDVQDVADYIIMRFEEAGSLSILKLQKLLYYVQAWHLALYDCHCFDGEFQAWVHGPVNRDVYDRFKADKSMYSCVTASDIRSNSGYEALPLSTCDHVNAVLVAYGGLTDDQLETMTHHEDPWIEARKGFKSNERCEVPIKAATMKQYYRQRTEAAQ
jgi:uncharacterized phage-associated protein